jgi:alpha-tubulin suppressor-like RCC1 family protein
VAVLNGVTAISAGRDFGLALRSDGIVFAWADNGRGQLGNGSTALISGPVQVANLNNATQVAAGVSFSLAVHTVFGFAGQTS